MKAGQFLSEEFVVGLDDEFRKLVRRQLRRVESRRGWIRKLGFQLIDDEFERDLHKRASLFEGAPALAAEIDAVTLEDA